MSPIYVPGKVTLRQTWQPMDPDAAAYITAVETADGLPLEEKVKIAIDNFVLGCKADGIWNAIKASCILAGARTRQGALIPLRNEFDVVNNIQPAAPQAFNFVDDDYDRKTGLKGDGSTKYLDSNRANDADPQDSKHVSVYVSALGTTGAAIGAGRASPGASAIFASTVETVFRNNSVTASFLAPALDTGFIGSNRLSGASYDARFNGANSLLAVTSQVPASFNYYIFANGLTLANYSNVRLAFYSIGESLDLAKLDARVTDLINAIGVAIP